MIARILEVAIASYVAYWVNGAYGLFWAVFAWLTIMGIAAKGGDS